MRVEGDDRDEHSAAAVSIVRPVSATQLRPLGVGEILDVAITIYRRNFRTLLTLVFVVVPPFEILYH